MWFLVFFFCTDNAHLRHSLANKSLLFRAFSPTIILLLWWSERHFNATHFISACSIANSECRNKESKYLISFTFSKWSEHLGKNLCWCRFYLVVCWWIALIKKDILGLPLMSQRITLHTPSITNAGKHTRAHQKKKLATKIAPRKIIFTMAKLKHQS